MQIYQCPNCGETYAEFEGIYYCRICNYRLVKQEDIKEIKHPELSKREYKVIGTVSNSTQNQIKCPTCGSNNVSKIGFISRAVSTSLFGLASSKIGKTHKCNNCGTTW